MHIFNAWSITVGLEFWYAHGRDLCVKPSNKIIISFKIIILLYSDAFKLLSFFSSFYLTVATDIQFKGQTDFVLPFCLCRLLKAKSRSDVQLKTMSWLRRPTPTAEALVRISRKAKFILSYCNETGVYKWCGVGSRGCVMVTSAGCCRRGEVDHVAAVELVCVGGLLRMGGESLLLPVWRSVGGEFTGKGVLDAWVVRAVTWQPG